MTACPICLGVFPGEGPDEWVCRCGTAWAVEPAEEVAA